MNRLKHFWIACLTAWLLGQAVAQASSVLWSDNFETNAAKRWRSGGLWQIGAPQTGPSSAYSPTHCATTQKYPANDSDMIYCTNYLSGSTNLLIPDASLSPTLTFYQWFNFFNAAGYVMLKDSSGTWQQISPLYPPSGATTTAGWVPTSIDLSPWANQNVQIGFFFFSGAGSNGKGWYVDDVAVVAETTLPVLTVPDTVTIYSGQTFSATNTATNTFLPLATYKFSLPAVSTNYYITNFDAYTGVLTWTNTGIVNGILHWTNNSVAPTNATITVVVADNSVPAQMVTNSFTLTILPPPGPTLLGVTNLTTALGGTVSTNYSATNSFVPATTVLFQYTFSLAQPSTNAWITTNGTFYWTNTAVISGTNRVYVRVKDNSIPPIMSTNYVTVIVSPPPLLVLPPTQTIHAGQTLVVTNFATNVFLPNSLFTYYLPAPSTNYWITTNGVLTWTNTGVVNGVFVWTNNSVAPGTNTIFVAAADNNSPPMTTVSNFNLIILPPLPPTLITPSNVTMYAGTTLVLTNYATNSVLPASVFTFSATGPANLDTSNLSAKGILSWTTPTTQTPGNYTFSVSVTDNSIPPLIESNSFTVLVSNPPPPTLILPPFQVIYPGQLMVVTNRATNSVFPNSVFTFAVIGGAPAGLDTSSLANAGILRWKPTAAQAGTIANIFVSATDTNSPPLSSFGNFQIFVQTTPPATLTPPAKGAQGGFQFSLATLPNTGWRIDGSSNLLTWLPLITNFSDPSGTLLFTDRFATNFNHRYYRAVLP